MTQGPIRENSLLIINAGASPLFNATTAPAVVCIRCASGTINEVGPDLSPRRGETVIDARQGAVVPGIHDHHLHLLATAAAQASLDCTGLTELQFVAALKKSAHKDGELRVVNYHENIAGPLDRVRLDSWVRDQSLRIQHSTGQMWFLNSKALAEYGLEHNEHQTLQAIERNPDGTPNGRLFRGDKLLTRKADKRRAPNLQALSRELASYGITGVTDTSHNNSDEEFTLLRAKQHSGELLQHLRVMGNTELSCRQGNTPQTQADQTPTDQRPRIQSGELKLLLDEAALPDLDELITTVKHSHQQNRSVAVHCVTRIELAIVLNVFGAAGVRQDRIEHASLLPASALTQIHKLGLTTVTQPGLIHSRGDRYAAELSAQEREELYRLQSLIKQEIPLALSSDAPYGPLNPWLNMQCSVDRKTASGMPLGSGEALTPEQALGAYCGSPEAPAIPRTIRPGVPADLAVLASPWSDVRENLAAAKVRATIRNGQLLPTD